MNKFFIKLILLSISFLIISYGLQFLIDKAILHSKLTQCNFWREIKNSNLNADIIILGSSRACYHLSPQVIERATKLKCCNLGMRGSTFNMQIASFLYYLQYNKKPKYVIQNIDTRGTLNMQISEIEQFLPFIKNPIIKETVLENNILTLKDYYLPLLKYDHSNKKIVIFDGIIQYFKNQYGQGVKDNYFTPNEKWDNSFENFKKEHSNGIRSEIDSLSKNKFEFFIDYCKKENIKLIFVYTPEYIQLQKLTVNRDSVMSIYRNYAEKYHFKLLDYSNNYICFDTLNFINSQHMNLIGVNKFSPLFINDLKGIIK